MDEFINKINFFMKNNPTNSYFIKINIPVDDRIFEFTNTLSNISKSEEISPTAYIKARTPYHNTLINDQNADILFNIACYIEKQLNIPKDRLQIIFSENRGLDVGGFFLLLDQVKREKLNFDFMIKLHTKRFNANHPGEGFGLNFGVGWRNILTSFLNIKINKILRSYECIYSCKLNSSDDNANNPAFVNLKKDLYNVLNILPDGTITFALEQFLLPLLNFITISGIGTFSPFTTC